MAEAQGPLHGVRVVEAATLAAGPLVSTAMGEFGAEVIKVEQPGAGDPLRTWGDRKDEVRLAANVLFKASLAEGAPEP